MEADGLEERSVTCSDIVAAPGLVMTRAAGVVAPQKFAGVCLAHPHRSALAIHSRILTSICCSQRLPTY